MKFKTVEEAENFYIGNFAATNNSKGEEDAMMDRWVEAQEIEECA